MRVNFNRTETNTTETTSRMFVTSPWSNTLQCIQCILHGFSCFFCHFHFFILFCFFSLLLLLFYTKYSNERMAQWNILMSFLSYISFCPFILLPFFFTHVFLVFSFFFYSKQLTWNIFFSLCPFAIVSLFFFSSIFQLNNTTMQFKIRSDNIPRGKMLMTWSELELKASSSFFHDGRLHLRCFAKIASVYAAAVEFEITEDAPLLAPITGDASPHWSSK